MDLFQHLKNHISMHPSRLDCLFHMIRGLCLFQSVRLRQLANAIPGTATLDSRIRRVQRFFQQQPINYVAVGKLVLSLLGACSNVTLTLDRTDWKFGQTPINFMVIGIMIGNMSVPLVFMNLNKRGNSNTKERYRLLKRLLEIIPSYQIQCLLADREFIGREWFEILIKAHIPFAIRIKESTMMLDPRTQMPISVRDYYRSVTPGSYLIETQIWGHKICLHFKKGRRRRKDILFLAVSSKELQAPWRKRYKKRWSIERMFLSMKTHGFNLEQTHLYNKQRLDKMMAVIAIAFVVCCKAGLFLQKKKPIPIKNHGRKLYSIFTYGLNWAQEQFYKNVLRPWDLMRIPGLKEAT